MSKHIFYLLLIAICVLIFLFSCKTTYIPIKVGEKSEHIKIDKLYENTIAKELKYNMLSMKMHAEIYQNDQKNSFTANLRIKKDSIIWINLQQYSIEGARIVITEDSLKYINRIDDTYFFCDFKTFVQHYGLDIDFNAIQSILTNAFFFYPCNNNKNMIDNFKNCTDPTLYCISSLSKRKISKYYSESQSDTWEKKLEKEFKDSLEYNPNNDFVFQIVKVSPDIYKIINIVLENYILKQSLSIFYNKQSNKFGQLFPEEINIELNTTQLKAKINLSVENISIDKENLKFPIKVGKKSNEINLFYKKD